MRQAAVLSVFFICCVLTFCTPQQQKTLESPVHAIGYVVYLPSGELLPELEDETVAHLFIFSTNTGFTPIDSATEVYVEIDGNGEQIEMENLGDGHYEIRSSEDPRLIYNPGSTYFFHFRVEDPALASPEFAQAEFFADIDASSDVVELTVSSYPDGPLHSAEIVFTPDLPFEVVQVFSFQYGAENLADAELTYSSVAFDSLDSVLNLILNHDLKSPYVISGDAFPYDDAAYAIVLYATSQIISGFDQHISPTLGIHSLFFTAQADVALVTFAE